MHHSNSPYIGLSGPVTLPAVQAAGFTHEQRFNTGTAELNYVEGPNNGPALVLIPAQMAMWEDYQKVLPVLAERFHVFALDVRGHGKSSWTPGDYSWHTVGEDMRAFLTHVVREPAIISGSSSGGIIALWCAANVPQYTRAIILEDAPLFAVEMPRFKERDKYTYNGLKHIVDSIGDVEHRDLADFFKVEAPVRRGNATKIKRVPAWFVRLMSRIIRSRQRKYPDQPVDIPYLPLLLRLAIKSISMFDPDFSRAFVDGRFYEGLNHEEALRRVACPMLIMQANWFRDPVYGLIGALDADDVARAQEIVPGLMHKRVNSSHVIHFHQPSKYLAAFDEFVTVNKLA